MIKEKRQDLCRDVEPHLDEALGFLNYEIDDYRDSGTSILDVHINTGNSKNWPEDWDEEIEYINSDIVEDYGG